MQQTMEVPNQQENSYITVAIEAVVKDESDQKEYVSKPSIGVLEVLPHSGQVQNLKAEHIAHHTIATVSWSEPEFISGRHFGYLVLLTHPNRSQQLKYTESHNITFTISEARHKSKFNVTVLTADKDHKNELVVGSEVSTSFAFNSLDGPRVKRIRRQSDQILYEVQPLEPDVDLTKVYFKGNGERLTNTTLVVRDLKPYSECIVRAQVCFLEGLCGDETLIRDQSNVAEPASVLKLTIRPIITTGGHFPSLDASWQRPNELNGPIDGYIVELLHGVDGPLFVPRVELSGSVTRYSFNKLAVDTVYAVRVQAFNTDVNTNQTRYIGPVSQDSALLPRFGNFSDVPTPYGIRAEGYPSWISLSWEISSQAIAKVFFVEAVPEIDPDPWVENKIVASFTRSTQIDLGRLRAFTKYRVSIQACREQQKESCGYPLQIPVKTLIDAPSPPRKLTHIRTETNITVYWKPPVMINSASLHGYTVILFELKSRKMISAITTVPSVRAASFGNLQSGATYRVHVKALNLNEDGNLYASSALEVDIKTDEPMSYNGMTVFIVIVVTGVLCGTAFAILRLRRSTNDGMATAIEIAEEL